MDTKRENTIRNYIDIIYRKSGKSMSVEIEGILGVIKQDGHIIFTSAGVQNSASIEAFLGGIVYGLLNLK